MDPLLLIWLARGGAVLLAAGAGWAFGRSVPSWQADEAMDEADPRAQNRYGGCGYPRGYGYSGYSSGWLLAGFRGNGWSIACAAGALALLPFAMDGTGESFFQPVMLFMALGAGAGYVAAVFTDKGPAGPLE